MSGDACATRCRGRSAGAAEQYERMRMHVFERIGQ